MIRFTKTKITVSKTTYTRVREDCGFFELLVEIVEAFYVDKCLLVL